MAMDQNYTPLFETKKAKRGTLFRLLALSVLVGICLVLSYRVSNLPERAEDGGTSWVWFGMFGAELWFGFYWILTQALRWNLVYRFTFKDKLSQRYEDDLPKVDIFVCTADPIIEPPLMVVNTVLSAMAYDYPPEKLAVYLSDDGGSDLTFYALLEATQFLRHWIPYCKKFRVEPRSPAAYFALVTDSSGPQESKDLLDIKGLYKQMEERIGMVTKYGRVPEEARLKNKGFSEWGNSYSSRHDHPTILQILIDGRSHHPNPNARDVDGCALPTLVYLAREKRPNYPHNFKAGAMNSLIRVSSEISNGKILLNVDCDMYSNNSQSVRDALCFFMDEKQNHDIAFVQFPQNFENITKNDLYGASLLAITSIEFHGQDGFGGPLYVGSGCFHRRDILSGSTYNEEECNNIKKATDELEEQAKPLANCTYEQNTPWGIEMGLIYGIPVEDVITGLTIQCKGWRSVYFNPQRKAFLGIAPTTLSQTLVQHKRWSEGDLQIFISKFSPAWYALGKLSIGLQMGYCCYCLWAVNCLATIYYSVIPSLCLLSGMPLFPKISSLWFIPFAYVVIAKYVYSLVEYTAAGGTAMGWWNEQRIWLYKRTSSYLFAFADTILKCFGLADSGFIVTPKVADDDALGRYEKDEMEFGDSSPMFTVLATLALLNLVCLVGAMKMIFATGFGETMALQILLSLALILINLPLYQGMFFRKDKGKMPASVTIKSLLLASLACTTFSLWH